MRRSHSRVHMTSWFPAALASAVVCGILVAWSPQFWAVALLHSAILFTGFAWLFFCSEPRVLPLRFIPLGIIASWGWLQLFLLGTSAHYATRVQAIEWTVVAVACCLSFQILRDGKARALFLAIILWASAAFSILAVLQIYSSPSQVFWMFPAQEFSVGTFLYKNQFAAMIELAVPISLYWILLKPLKRLSGIFAFLMLFGGAVASGSRAGIILVLAECLVAVMAAYRYKKISIGYLFAIIPATLLVLGGAALLFGGDYVWEHFQESHPYALRQELLRDTVQMYRQEPWSGYGLGAWPTVYPAYATFDIGRVANAAHNDWAEWASEGGAVFVGCILIFFVPIILPAIESIWGLGVVSIMLHSWVDYPTREPVLCVLWFCMAGAIIVSAAEEAEQREGISQFHANP